MVIPRFISQAMQGEPLTIYGDGQQTRTFCSVHDVVRAVELLCNSSEIQSQVFNIGASGKVTIQNLAEKVIDTMQSSSTLEFIPETDLPAGFDDIRHSCPDIQKIYMKVGWEPEISLDEILNSAISDLLKSIK
jgi:UDP-glucose 4-epimerase